MNLKRRNLLTGGAALAGLSCLGGETLADEVADPNVPDDAIILTAIVKARPEEVEAVKDALMTMVEPTRQEPGCLCYNLHQSKSDPTQFMFYEQWASKEAFDAHGGTPHMKALRGKLKGKTDKGGGATFYELL